MMVPEGHAKVKSVASTAGTGSPKSKFGANNDILTIWCPLSTARTYGPATPTSWIVTQIRYSVVAFYLRQARKSGKSIGAEPGPLCVTRWPIGETYEKERQRCDTRP